MTNTSHNFTFKKFTFHPHVTAGIKAAGFSTPTPIQTHAIPKIMQGHDLIGMAQTGTGKTAAFVLPILDRLLCGRHGCPRALIITPTRELAEQIHQNITLLGTKTRLRSVTVYGGVGIQQQIKLLKHADIIVACPGRLLDHINRQTVDLSSIEALVLDEADHMFDMGFLPDVQRILSCLPRTGRQTLLFSATMPEPIRRLAKDILTDHVQIQIGQQAPAQSVKHTFYPVKHHLKTSLLITLLTNIKQAPVLVFTRTKHRAKQIDKKIANAGFRSASLQGNLSQTRRQEVMTGFKSGKYQVLVATDIAARGIDVTKISHVINYDLPSTAETYIHRIGRTGRAESKGQAVSLITEDDNKMVKAIHRAVGRPVEQHTVPGFDYHAGMPTVSVPSGYSRSNTRFKNNGSKLKRQRRPRKPLTSSPLSVYRPQNPV